MGQPGKGSPPDNSWGDGGSRRQSLPPSVRGQLLGLLLLWSSSGAPVPALGSRLRSGIRRKQCPATPAFMGGNGVTRSVICGPEKAAQGARNVTKLHAAFTCAAVTMVFVTVSQDQVF